MVNDVGFLKKMEIFGLIGKKLGHSFSASYFNAKFERENIDARYDLFEIPSIEGISNIISSNPGLRGLNVTIPYKEEIIPYLDDLTPEASAIGAVNTVKVLYDSGGRTVLLGHNTDAPGFKKALLPLLTPAVRRALVLGRGGASKAVSHILSSIGIEVTWVSRKKAEGVLDYDSVSPEIIKGHHLIVNCTPLGMWPNTDELPALPYFALTPSHICFDLIYNPSETAFMRKSKERGATVSNGLQMLHNQADSAWDFWNNKIS